MNSKFNVIVATVIILILLFGITLFYFQIYNAKSKASIPIRVACVGDSLTWWTQYPNNLWMLLGSNYTVNNFGVGGATIASDSGKPYINELMFQNAKEFEPNIVIVMLGTNDANPALKFNISSFVSNYLQLITDFQKLDTKPEVLIVKPPPIFNNGTGLSSEKFETSVIPAIEEVANQTNLPFIDLYTPLFGHSEYFKDGVHLNNEGSQIVANIVYNALIS